MSINLICEDWLVEEKGWDITHGRDHKGNGIKKYTTPTAVFMGEKSGHLYFMPREPVCYQYTQTWAGGVKEDVEFEELLREHRINRHVHKLEGCKDCEFGYMQALGQRTGASAKYHDDTLAMDTVDHGHEDNNGHRYTVHGGILQTYFGDVRNNKHKD